MEQEKPNSLWYKIKRYITECVRVIRVTKKPTSQEFRTVVKVTALGMVLIGFIGFAIATVRQLLFK